MAPGQTKGGYTTFQSTTGLVEKYKSYSLNAKAVALGFLLVAVGAFVGLKGSQAWSKPQQSIVTVAVAGIGDVVLGSTGAGACDNGGTVITEASMCIAALDSLGIPNVSVQDGDICYKDASGNGYANGRNGAGAQFVCSGGVLGWTDLGAGYCENTIGGTGYLDTCTAPCADSQCFVATAASCKQLCLANSLCDFISWDADPCGGKCSMYNAHTCTIGPHESGYQTWAKAVEEADASAANTCTCTDGSAKTGTECTTNSAQMCASCNTGFHATGDTCTANTCTCTDGSAKTGTQCTTHSAQMCASCSTGFHATGDTCTANTCTCTDGIAKTGTECTADSAEMCASCFTGFHASGDTCTAC